MASKVGFKRVHIGIWDKDETKIVKKFTWEGKKGGTVNMNVSGLAADSQKVYASNGPVWVANKGTGDVKADLELFNAPEADLNEVLGYKVTGKEAWAGAETQPPYISIIAETADTDGNPILVALAKATASLDSIKLETLEEKTKAPENDKLSLACLLSKIDGEEMVYGTFRGESKDDPDAKAFMDKVFVGYQETATTVNSVTLSKDSTSITQGQTEQLSATTDPVGQPVTYSVTSGSEFISVSSTGLITANAQGSAVVTATSGDKTDTINVTVLPIG